MPIIIDVIAAHDSPDQNAISHSVTSTADPAVSSIIDRVENASSLESMLMTPKEISFSPAQTVDGSVGISSYGTAVLENVAGTDFIRVNGNPYPVNPTGTTTSVPFRTSSDSEYKFEYCKSQGTSLVCSKPFMITIPEPK